MRAILQNLRIQRGYTQLSMAQTLGISRSHYSQIEGGSKDPAFHLAIKIKALLGYPHDDIFTISGNKGMKGHPYKTHSIHS